MIFFCFCSETDWICETGFVSESRSQDDDAVRIKKEHEVDTDERIEITDSSHDHDKSSSTSRSSNSSSSNSSSSSDDDNKETGDDDSVSQVIPVPDQPIPVAGDAPFMGSSANVIIEDTGLIDSAAANDPNSEKLIEILSVGGAMVSNETPSLPKPNETTAQVSSGTDSDVKEAPSSLLESNDVPQGSRESEVVISHEEEEEVIFNCFGLFHILSCCLCYRKIKTLFFFPLRRLLCDRHMELRKEPRG